MRTGCSHSDAILAPLSLVSLRSPRHGRVVPRAQNEHSRLGRERCPRLAHQTRLSAVRTASQRYVCAVPVRRYQQSPTTIQSTTYPAMSYAFLIQTVSRRWELPLSANDSRFSRPSTMSSSPRTSPFNPTTMSLHVCALHSMASPL